MIIDRTAIHRHSLPELWTCHNAILRELARVERDTIQSIMVFVLAVGGEIRVPDSVLRRLPPGAELTHYEDLITQETVFRVKSKGGPDVH